jgi:hypothetical protein
MTTYDKDPKTKKIAVVEEQSLPAIFEDYKPEPKKATFKKKS